jgi:hypothetical protein
MQAGPSNILDTLIAELNSVAAALTLAMVKK